MVIGNGFFTDTETDAVKEMETRSRAKVKAVPYSTVGNIRYFASETGDIYGMQMIQGKCLTRTKKPVKYKKGYTARLQESPRHELWVPLDVLIYCTFVLN